MQFTCGAINPEGTMQIPIPAGKSGIRFVMQLSVGRQSALPQQIGVASLPEIMVWEGILGSLLFSVKFLAKYISAKVEPSPFGTTALHLRFDGGLVVVHWSAGSLQPITQTLLPWQ